MKPRACFLAPFLLLLAACATPHGKIGTVQAPPAATWAFETSDVPVDPAFRFGKLPNGMRYVIRQNATPVGTALVRLEIGSGSLAEHEDERGYAHFIEHMAFNGSTRVPEGEMIRLLERNGLAFGADTNASTGFEQTIYKLDLPRNDPSLLDTALMLMRETASELTIAQGAVDRERGVVLSEMRDRNSFDLRNYIERTQFLTPGALYTNRLPIGTTQALLGATADSLRAFWQREYVPSNAVVVVIGDFDPAIVEQAIASHFAGWAPAPAPAKPDPGPVDPALRGKTDIYIDPALSERVSIARHGAWLDERDSIAVRQRNLLRQIGYAIVNRRLERIARQESPPFRGAGFGTGDIFKIGRTTRLIVDTGDGEWRAGLVAAAREYERAIAFGFTPGEVAEQVANIRAATQNAAAGAATRSNEALFGAVAALLHDDIVPATPQSSLERLEAFLPAITPASVLKALKEEAVPLKDPLIRFEGRSPPAGGAEALRAAWKEAASARLEAGTDHAAGPFGYTDFGAPGTVRSDQRESGLGIRRIVFANGVRLNLKPTALQRDRVRVRLNIDGGQMLDTRQDPLATSMTSSLPLGGLGKHTADELESLLAGRNVGWDIDDGGDSFVLDETTTPADLELQLQLLAASITDPAYRPQGESIYRRNIANFFASKDATPQSAMSNGLGGILSDNDPRFTLQPMEAYRALTFARLRDTIADRLARGALEVALVGDFNEEDAIAKVARTLGALSAREPDFRAYDDQRNRGFTMDRSVRTIRHKGAPDQALLRFSWPTTDDRDQAETLRLALLEKVVRIELLDSLREALGKAYSPTAASNPSHDYRGYGTFDIAASVNVSDVGQTQRVVRQTVQELLDAPVSGDVLERARQPMLGAYDNALKSNAGWMSLVARAQSEDYRIGQFLAAKAMLLRFTAQDLQDTARRYLSPGNGVTVIALPEGVDAH